ncbi:SDR family oxidoreductase [Burkholderia anthina]|uniref:SDR family oxidoreductase n=1 Tax=Burkholderia anthina TaxID=179879 RepID=UPI00158BA128|nr:SDR family oxidoreductase [Burkholderia anthina]
MQYVLAAAAAAASIASPAGMADDSIEIRHSSEVPVIAGQHENFSGHAGILKTDVTDRADVQALVDRAVALHGRVDVLLNNAGLMPSSMLDKLKVDEWDRMIDVNIKGVLYGIAAVLPHMQKQMAGQIINVSSVAGHKVGPGGAVYAGTKWAVRAISEGLRQEVKPWNIRTTIVSPGAVATELVNTITDADVAAGMAKTYEKAIPPSSFARVVEFVISQPDDVDINEVLFRPTSQVY